MLHFWRMVYKEFDMRDTLVYLNYELVIIFNHFQFFPHLVIAMMIEQTGTSAPSGDDDLSMGISLMLDIYLIFNCGYCHCCSSCYVFLVMHFLNL